MGGTLRTNSARSRAAKRRERLEQRVHEALEEAARVALEVARSLAPGKVPQTLKAYATRGFVAGVRVTSTWSKVRFVEHDTSAHVIEPRTRKVLRFVQNGEVRFARRVNHPGTKGYHFMARAREAGREVLRRLLDAAIRET